MSAYLYILLIVMATCLSANAYAFRPQALLRCRAAPATAAAAKVGLRATNNHDANTNTDVGGTNANSENNKPAYVVIEAKLKESEMERFGLYASQVPALVSKYGGEYLVLGGHHEALEGDWDTTRIVLHRWPSMVEARKFWDSDEYQELKKLREGTGEFRIMLLEGFDSNVVSET